MKLGLSKKKKEKEKRILIKCEIYFLLFLKNRTRTNSSHIVTLVTKYPWRWLRARVLLAYKVDYPA